MTWLVRWTARPARWQIPAVGNTVDLEAANWTNTIGASEL